MVIRPRRSNRWRSRFLSLCTLVLTILATPTIGNCEPEHAAPSTLSHSAFVALQLDTLAARLLDGFTPHRSRPVLLRARSTGFADSLLQDHISDGLARRGLLLRPSGGNGAADEPDLWVVDYGTDAVSLHLSEPSRQSFLGAIWLKRTLHAQASMHIHDAADSAIVWEASADTTCSDWILKRDLPGLADRHEAALAPIAPLTGWERAAVPVTTGAIAAALTGLFLILR